MQTDRERSDLIDEYKQAEPRIERTRASIPTRLRLAGVQYEVTNSADGALRYIINGETLTPGEAVDRYL